MRPLLERSLSTAGLHHRRKKNSESHSHLFPSIVHDAQSDEMAQQFVESKFSFWRMATVKGECIGVSSACQCCFPALTVT